MAKHRVGVLERHEAPETSSPANFCGQAIAERIVNDGRARRIGKRLIHILYGTAAEAIHLAKEARDLAEKAKQKIRIGFTDGPFGVGNLLPFFKAQNPLMRPEKLHYEIPQAGECRSICLTRFGLRRKISGSGTGPGENLLISRTIHVSGRKLDFAALRA